MHTSHHASKATPSPTIASLLGLKPEHIRTETMRACLAAFGHRTLEDCINMARIEARVTPRDYPHPIPRTYRSPGNFQPGLAFLIPEQEFNRETVGMMLRLFTKYRHWRVKENAIWCVDAGIAPLARMAAQHVLSLTHQSRLGPFIRELDRLAPGNPRGLTVDWFAKELAKHGRKSIFPRRPNWRPGDPI